MPKFVSGVVLQIDARQLLRRRILFTVHGPHTCNFEQETSALGTLAVAGTGSSSAVKRPGSEIQTPSTKEPRKSERLVGELSDPFQASLRRQFVAFFAVVFVALDTQPPIC